MNRILFLMMTLFAISGCTNIQKKSDKPLCIHEHVGSSKYTSVKKFEKQLASGDELFIVFGADWCKPCIYLFERLKEARIIDSVIFLNVDTTWAFILSKRLGVQGLPTLVVLKNGRKEAMRTTPGEILIYLLANIESKD